LSNSNVVNQSVYSQGGGAASRKRRGQSGEDENAVANDRGASLESGGEDEEGNGDETLYCVCQQKSYGEMIGCDNDNCRLEWVSAYARLSGGLLVHGSERFLIAVAMVQFHLKCVKLEPPLPEEWYCEECTRLLKEQKKMKRKK
jgi:chromatin modification-related protein YNG2